METFKNSQFERPRPSPILPHPSRRHSWSNVRDSSQVVSGLERQCSDPNIRASLMGPESPKSPNMPERLRQAGKTADVPSLRNSATRPGSGNARLPPLSSLSPRLRNDILSTNLRTFVAFRRFSAPSLDVAEELRATADTKSLAEPAQISSQISKTTRNTEAELQAKIKAEERRVKIESIDGPFSEAERTRMVQIFDRFAEEGEVARWDLVLILTLLGYLSASEETVDKATADVSDCSTLDLQEFVGVVVKVIDLEEARLEAAFRAEDKAGSGKIKSHQCLQSLLRSLGVVALRTPVLEALEAAGLQGVDSLDHTEVVRFLKAYKAAEGFTKKETSSAAVLFRDRATLQFGEGGRSNPMLEQGEVCDALVQLFGLQMEPRARQLMERLNTSEDSAKPPMDFREFLAFARQLRNVEILEIWRSFQHATDENSRISMEVLTAQLPRTLMVQGSDLRQLFPPRCKSKEASSSPGPTADTRAESRLPTMRQQRCRRLSTPAVSHGLTPPLSPLTPLAGGRRPWAENSLASVRRNSAGT
eukprot:gnl/TRDRNA2_/TRDRNA2_173429_c0_seq1.p1 gnl/TRDRNA2_/TRDRNA2_173429_c0~~gnl/TRDRNA2_/TRDRNA2_173429_c0_seq1.p1  ORF type:complete len:534 (-),score=72.28 gnl/TRDRNA2_/TRDRNA2_173429_c0_seq1:20-1621(-)